MVLCTLLFGTRKDGLTMEEFKDHYENVHLPLIKEMSGNKFPILHARKYIARAPETSSSESTGAEKVESAEHPTTVKGDLFSGAGRAPGAALTLVGTEEDFQWDVVAELRYRDEEHFKSYIGVFHDEVNVKRLADDEAKFIKPGSLKAVVLGEVLESKNEKMQ